MCRPGENLKCDTNGMYHGFILFLLGERFLALSFSALSHLSPKGLQSKKAFSFFFHKHKELILADWGFCKYSL